MKQVQHPSALDMFEQITNASKGKQIVMFLDYDGTLSPIVEDPDRAFMSDSVITPTFFFFPKIIKHLSRKKPVLFLFLFFFLRNFWALNEQMRSTVKKLARYFPTAIVTGRCRDKVYSFVRLAELYYAGSHGMDIKGPSKGSKCKKVSKKFFLTIFLFLILLQFRWPFSLLGW